MRLQARGGYHSRMDTQRSLAEAAAARGWRIAFLAPGRIGDLEAEIARMLESGAIAEGHYRYLMDCYEFKAAAAFPAAAGIVVLAAPSRLRRLSLVMGGERRVVDLPPGFAERNVVEAEALDAFGEILAAEGKRIARVELPEKLAAARSSLARIGRNGIAYVDGMGSFLRLACFVTDRPFEESAWRAVSEPEACASCGACVRACPTGAIRGGGMPVAYERCLCHWNEETEGPFPSWIDGSWHNAAIGCMRCQAVCPLDAPFKKGAAPGPSFDQAETDAILSGGPYGEALRAKLVSCGLWKHRALLPRNLLALGAR